MILVILLLNCLIGIEEHHGILTESFVILLEIRQVVSNLCAVGCEQRQIGVLLTLHQCHTGLCLFVSLTVQRILVCSGKIE